MSDDLVRFVGVTKSFLEQRPILRDVNVNLKRGEFIFLTGVSGCGKSSMLKLIHRQLSPDSGHVEFEGRPVGRLRLHQLRQRIGFAFQDYKLLEGQSVESNVTLPLRILGLDGRTIERRLAEIAKFCMIEKLLERQVRTLSGGEQQLVSMARAGVHRPSLILADEPTANLDRQATLKILALLQSFQRIGVTVLVATHDIELLKSYKTRILLIQDRKIRDIHGDA